MTNQTIDGVPRELLNRLLAWLNRANELNGDGDIAEYLELRALLDADKVNNRQMGLMQYVEAHPIKQAEERGSSHGFEQSPNTCRHDERSGVWWREGSITRTGRECCACGSVEEDPVKKAAQPQGEPVAEVVSKFGDPEAFGEREIIVRQDLSKIPYGTKLYRQPPSPALTVWYGAMPESNGKTNWTAILHRKGECMSEGITIDRSEYPERVRYEADRMLHLIGVLKDEPDILAYDPDKHSGYVKAEQPAPVAVVLPERSNAVASANVSAKQAYALGWNACLDEVTRLNGIKS